MSSVKGLPALRDGPKFDDGFTLWKQGIIDASNQCGVQRAILTSKNFKVGWRRKPPKEGPSTPSRSAQTPSPSTITASGSSSSSESETPETPLAPLINDGEERKTPTSKDYGNDYLVPMKLEGKELSEAEEFGAAHVFEDEFGILESDAQMLQRNRMWNYMVRSLEGTTAAHLLSSGDITKNDIGTLYVACKKQGQSTSILAKSTITRAFHALRIWKNEDFLMFFKRLEDVLKRCK